jgi:hypothetical protein
MHVNDKVKIRDPKIPTGTVILDLTGRIVDQLDSELKFKI